MPGTSTACESLHSVASKISQGQRSSLKPSNVGLFSIGKVLLTQAVNEIPALKLVQEDVAVNGLHDVEDELEEAISAQCFY